MAKLTKKAEKQIGEYLTSMTREQLTAEVMDRVAEDATYARSLTIRAGKASGNIDPAIYRRAINDALRSGSAARRDDPRTSGRWASGVLDTISPVVALIDEGHGAVVIDICEYALGRVEKLMGTRSETKIHRLIRRCQPRHHLTRAAGTQDNLLKRQVGRSTGPPCIAASLSVIFR